MAVSALERSPGKLHLRGKAVVGLSFRLQAPRCSHTE
jgi:hypothetical protein